MSRLRRERSGPPRRAIAAALFLALGLGLSCCGNGSREDPAVARGVILSFPDFLDPALTQTLEGTTAMANTYIPLLTYPHADGPAGTVLRPGLARGLPRISDGGRTYTLFLRDGLRYSDGTPIRASDFGRTIERSLAMSAPTTPFFEDIVGAERFIRTKKGRIGGIESDDRTGRITIHLRQRRGTFSNELALLAAAPLPGDTPREDLSSDPPPASGPYEIASSHPGRGWSYDRNPEWASTNGRRLPQIPAGHFDQIEYDVNRNVETEVNEVESGAADFMGNPPGPSRLPDLKREFAGSQLIVTPQIDVYYFWMNTQQPPFNDIRVRRAVNYAIAPAALDRIYGGQLAPLQQVLPVGMPGHRTYRLYPHDMAKARALIRAADPSDRSVTVWTNSFGPNRDAGEYLESVLQSLGFDTTLHVIGAANYFTVIGNETTPDLDTGLTNWFLDYPHPQDYFGRQLDGNDILPTLNSNLSRFDDPKVNDEIERLQQQPLGPRQIRAYARLDRQVMRSAPWAPFGSLTLSTFFASRIDTSKVVISPIFGLDLTSLALNPGS